MRDLIRHFFERFFEKEALSPEGDPSANIVQTLGFLAVPGAFVAILLQPLSFRQWDLVGIRCLFISFSMIVMGFLVVFEWEALFPDRRDYQILTPLPIGLFRLFLTKGMAFALFLGLFLLDINFFSTLLWAGVDSGKGVLSIIAAHLVIVVLSGLFAALSMAALQGVLIAALPATAFRRVSVWVQTALMGLLVLLLFVSPLLAMALRGLIRRHSIAVYAYPPFWFAGLYDRLRPAVKSPALVELGNWALWGLAAAAGLFILTYLPGYRSHARKVLEAPQPSPRGPGRLRSTAAAWIDAHILRRPAQIAVFHFINQTITRSMKHRLFLAAYAGCGSALAILTLLSGRDGLLRLPLTLSFILISALRAAFNFPSELGANWAFQMSECHTIGDCLTGMRKWIVICAIAPLLVLQVAMEFACFPWGAAIFHLAFDTALAALLMECMFVGFRKVPFACSYFPGKVNLVFLAVIYVLGFTIYSGTMASLEAWLATHSLVAVFFFVLAAAMCVSLERWRCRQLNAESILEYQDPGDPVVRTLELSA
jgi:hypothetical protein